MHVTFGVGFLRSAERPISLSSNGFTSVFATVAVAINAPDAVDIIAATAAASTMPLMPTGRIVSAIWAYTSSLASTSGRNVDAAIPITAPATP